MRKLDHASVTEREIKILKRKNVFSLEDMTVLLLIQSNGCFSKVITWIHLRSASARSLARTLLMHYSIHYVSFFQWH